MREPIINLTNDILRDEKWDPIEVYSMLRDTLAKMKRNPNTHPNSFGVAKPPLAEVKFFPLFSDGYIDEIVTMFLGVGD